MPDGCPVELITLREDGGIELRAITYGGIITAVLVPDRVGVQQNVVLGHATLTGYLTDRAYLGALIGRYANRIGRGHLEIDGRRFQLPANDGLHHLHGGPRGFHTRIWKAEVLRLPDAVGVALTRTSAAGEEGYPGALDVSVHYTLRSGGRVTIEYAAQTDAPTIVNLTQHTYFNLGADDVLDHELTIHANQFIPVGPDLIPIGAIADVYGTPFDFRAPIRIGARLRHEEDQLRFGLGYDHNWILRNGNGSLKRAAVVTEPLSRRTLEVTTTEPGLQFYSGGQLPGARQYTGFCLETQHFPDTPNQPSFPSVVLRPGERYQSTTIWRFGIG
jgi:aldose 1-epimerase